MVLSDLEDVDYEKDEIMENQKYQLLNEIKSAVPLSSLNAATRQVAGN